MKVSVIIPVYNGEKTIKRCIDSVLNQTLEDIEVIVVNDGSTDGTLEILKGFTDTRLKIITQENAGQGYARNTGMDAAKGEYIGFVDADDTIEPQMYEEMYRLAKEYDVEAVQCRAISISSDGKRRILHKSDIEGLITIDDSADYMAVYMAREVYSAEVWNKLFRRDFINSNKLRFCDTKQYFAEDILFNIKTVEYLKRIYFCPATYYNYYQLSESHMHKGIERRVEKLQVLFDDYIRGLGVKMKNSVSVLASMHILCSIGVCGKTNISKAAAKRVDKYIKPALKAKCGLKRRVYLTVVLCSPVSVRIWLATLLK